MELSSCPFVLSPIFLYFLLFEFLWAFVKKSVVTFSEYRLGGREQCHKKIYKQEDLQQIPFENITPRLWLSAQSAFFFRSSEPIHLSWLPTVAVNYPTVMPSCVDITNFILIFLPTSPWCKCIFQRIFNYIQVLESLESAVKSCSEHFR